MRQGALLSIVLWLAGAPVCSAQHISQPELTVQQVFAGADHGVVKVETFDHAGKSTGFGSGFLLSPRG